MKYQYFKYIQFYLSNSHSLDVYKNQTKTDLSYGSLKNVYWLILVST